MDTLHSSSRLPNGHHTSQTSPRGKGQAFCSVPGCCHSSQEPVGVATAPTLITNNRQYFQLCGKVQQHWQWQGKGLSSLFSSVLLVCNAPFTPAGVIFTSLYPRYLVSILFLQNISVDFLFETQLLYTGHLKGSYYQLAPLQPSFGEEAKASM